MKTQQVRLSYVYDNAPVSMVIPVEQDSPDLACAAAAAALLGLFSGVSNIKAEVVA